MSKDSHNKGQTDASNGEYRPPSNWNPSTTQQDQEDYRLGHQKAKAEKDASEGRSRDPGRIIGHDQYTDAYNKSYSDTKNNS